MAESKKKKKTFDMTLVADASKSLFQPEDLNSLSLMSSHTT